MTYSNKRYQLVIRKSVNHMYATINDTVENIDVYSVSTLSLKSTSNMSSCGELGKKCGIKIVELGIQDDISFNRSRYKFHGKVKALADAARESGAKF